MMTCKLSDAVDEYKSNTLTTTMLIFAVMKCLLLLTTVLLALVATGHCYYIGVSQYDITGPAAEINMVSILLCYCSV